MKYVCDVCGYVYEGEARINPYQKKILLLLGLFGGLDAVLPLLWEGYARVSPLLHLLGGGLTLTVPLIALLRRQRREKAVPDLPTETEEERIRRVARELADSVCPPRAC